MLKPTLFTILLLSLAVVPAAGAQGMASTGIIPAPDTGPKVGVLAHVAPADRPDLSRLTGKWIAESRRRRGKAEVLMIVGGAAFLTGLLVDETLITVAGAGVGGYGLYLHLNE